MEGVNLNIISLYGTHIQIDDTVVMTTVWCSLGRGFHGNSGDGRESYKSSREWVFVKSRRRRSEGEGEEEERGGEIGGEREGERSARGQRSKVCSCGQRERLAVWEGSRGEREGERRREGRKRRRRRGRRKDLELRNGRGILSESVSRTARGQSSH